MVRRESQLRRGGCRPRPRCCIHQGWWIAWWPRVVVRSTVGPPLPTRLVVHFVLGLAVRSRGPYPEVTGLGLDPLRVLFATTA
jgi:hypothetical protein